ncbi:MAG TPA: T9SS type A sorting domain-containing protein [Bacteroidia bacterium]|jgi:sugar lactone lactonase YvrE|nr:T9SS type A sorting domain-containing protein [Bacteroidia bacterium]
MNILNNQRHPRSIAFYFLLLLVYVLLKKYTMNKTYLKSILVAILACVSFASYSQIISTIAGIDTFGFSGDGGQATSAEMGKPEGIALDGSGNIYIADVNNGRIRKISASGIITTIAGGGSNGLGDGGPATDAELNAPVGIILDGSGNIYIADFYENRIRIINTSGIIRTFAGNGVQSFYGDGGPATDAELNAPYGLAIDTSGNIYIADCSNDRIRIVNISGIIRTFAGISFSGFSGDGGQATSAELNAPTGITSDNSGNVYIADWNNNCIRVVNTSGIISTFAGNRAYGYSGDGGPATSAEFYSPTDVDVDVLGNIYIADQHNDRIRIVNTSGSINTFVGNGYNSPNTGGYSGDGGSATDAELYLPESIAVDAMGNIYIGDELNNRVRKVTISTGINEFASAHNPVAIYPVPNSGSFTISGIAQGQIIELYNYLGQQLSSTIADKATIQFDISGYPNGIYLIRVQNKDGSIVATKKVVKTD